MIMLDTFIRLVNVILLHFFVAIATCGVPYAPETPRKLCGKKPCRASAKYKRDTRFTHARLPAHPSKSTARNKIDPAERPAYLVPRDTSVDES